MARGAGPGGPRKRKGRAGKSAPARTGLGAREDEFYRTQRDPSDPREVRISIGMEMFEEGDAPGGLSYLRALARDEPGYGYVRAALGSALSSTGAYGEAIAEFREALRLGAGDAGTYNNLGIAYDSAGLTEEALECYQESIRQDPEQAPPRINLSGMYRIQGRLEEAAKAADEALRLEPGHPDACLAKGAALADMGRFSESLEPLRDAVGAAPESYEALMCLGQSLLCTGDGEGALRCFDEAVRLDPEDPWGHHDRGTALAQLARFQEAYDSYSRSAELEPRAPTYSHMAEAASSARGSGDAGALALANKALEMDPDYAFGHLVKARLLRAAGRDSEAEGHFLRARALDPSLADGPGGAPGRAEKPAATGAADRMRAITESNLAKSYRLSGRSEDEAKSADESPRPVPGDCQASAAKGAALAGAGGFPESVGPLLGAARALPGCVDALVQLGQSLSAVDAAGALRCFEEAARLDPIDPRGHHETGNMLARLGRYQDAYDAYGMAARLETNAKTLASMAMALHNMHVGHTGAPGDWHAHALLLADKAIEADPEYGYAYFVKSRLLRAAGRDPEAEDHLLRARMTDPDSVWDDNASRLISDDVTYKRAALGLDAGWDKPGVWRGKKRPWAEPTNT